MNRRLHTVSAGCAAVLFGLVGGGIAAPVAITPKPEPKAAQAASTDTTTVLHTMLLNYWRYAETLWHDQPTERTGYWGSGRADGGNEGVRAIANTALVYALLSRRGDSQFPVANRVEPALRYAAAIHTTGTATGTDKKKWGNSWQSAMWAANLGVAAYLAKDKLAPETRAAVERVVAFEADRFLTIPPPDREPGDTKAEENAWNLTAPAAAILLMPNHPNAGRWHQAVERYAMNTLSVEADKNASRVIDRRPVREWVTTTQLNPDFTLENHGMFHPVYAMVAPVTLGQTAVYYRLAGKPVPDALQYNVLNGWEMLRYVTQEDGEWLYPQGLDWDLHDYEHLHYWTMLATLYKDPAAAYLEARTVQFARKRQEINKDGSFVGPSGNLGFAREAVQAERVAFALLMHDQFGEPAAPTAASWKRTVAGLQPVKAFIPSGFVVHRTPNGLLSFSWKNHLMGLAAPSSAAYPDAPYVTTPNTQSLVGSFSVEGQKPQDEERFTLTRSAVRTDKTGFVVAADVWRNAGVLRQQIAVATAAPGILVYMDRVTATKAAIITGSRALVVSVENDAVSGGRRRILTASPSEREVMAGVAADTSLTGNWANIDNRLGLIAAPGSNLLYRAVEKTNRAGAREDFLYGDYASGSSRTVAVGDVVTERVGLLLPGVSAQDTAKVAASLKVEPGAAGRTVRFTGTDGKSYVLTLGTDGKVTWQGVTVVPK